MRAMAPIPARRIAAVRKALLAWYYKHRRSLPWRNTRDPYRIWISEIMAQQTRIETVVPYYERFIRRFPRIHDLAQAQEEDVLKLWEGLGYYSRARNLHSAAKEVCESYGGKLPPTAQELKQLKGFGPYTSASVASIAFGEAIACVDGNVRRVLSRCFETHEPVEPYAAQLIDAKDPSGFNQGLMELGARVCLPRKPKCELCPLQKVCQAHHNDSVSHFPSKKEKTKVKQRSLGVFILRQKTRVLFLKRSSTGLWGGMWELPSFDLAPKSTKNDHLQSLRERFGVDCGPLSQQGSFKHILSHQKIDVTVFEANITQTKDVKKLNWLTPREVRERPLSRLQQKAWEMRTNQTP